MLPHAIIGSIAARVVLALAFPVCLSAQQEAMFDVLQGENVIGRGVFTERTETGCYGYTALHVVQEVPSRFRIRWANGTTIKQCQVVDRWVDADVAKVWIDAPSDVEPVPLATEWDTAWSIDIDGNRVEFKHCWTERGREYFDYSPRAGESGGPVFSGRELVGIVSGGWFWSDQMDESGRKYTWPLRVGRIPR